MPKSKIIHNLVNCTPLKLKLLAMQMQRDEDSTMDVQHTQNANEELFDEDTLGRRNRSGNRLSEAITRLIADRKLRAANKLLVSQADGQEATIEEKITTLQSKLKSINNVPVTFDEWRSAIAAMAMPASRKIAIDVRPERLAIE